MIPLDSVHAALVDELADGLAAAAGMAAPWVACRTSRSLPTRASNAVRPAAIAAAIAGLPPFVVHAHGYGLFAGHGSGDLNVHVPVVRNESLAALHRVVLDATRSTGAVIAGWTEPDAWTPHITLLSLALDPTRLGTGVTWLAAHHHPSWQIPVDRVVVTGGWTERSATSVPIPLGP